MRIPVGLPGSLFPCSTQERRWHAFVGGRTGRFTLLCLTLFVALASGCHRGSAEQQVRAAITQAADAARERDAGRLGDLLSEDLATPTQAMDRAHLLGLLRLMRLRDEPVKVLMGPVSVEPRGKRMMARFTVTLGGGGGLIPRQVGVYHVTSAWRREDGDWRCYSVSWTRKM